MIDTIYFRRLDLNDREKLESMETAIDDDYVVRIFDRLINEDVHELYGLFVDEKLVAVGGYTLYREQYAMLGRLRTDINYRGKGYATMLLSKVIEEIKKKDYIKWVGGNTQRNNHSGMGVLSNLNLPRLIDLHASTLADASKLPNTEGEVWRELVTIEEKRKWLDEVARDPSIIFPYQCYYPFPASPALFDDEEIEDWLVFENEAQDRFLVVKVDQKRYKYAQVGYLWDDLFEQDGLWKTVLHAHERFKKAYPDEEVYVWADLTDELKDQLKNQDAFTYQDPWVLHGKWLD